MQRTHLISALAILAIAPVAWAVPDGGGTMGPRNAPNAAQDTKSAARNEYNLGYEGVQSVAKLELEAALMPAFASQYRDTVRAGFVKARENFRKAVAADPDMKEGWNMLGYTSRKLGEYASSRTTARAPPRTSSPSAGDPPSATTPEVSPKRTRARGSTST
jgi:hypothetical protein